MLYFKTRLIGFAHAILLGMALLVASQTSFGHAFAPSLLEITEVELNHFAVRWKEPRTRVSGSSLQPVLPQVCTGIGTPELRVEGTGLVTDWAVSCPDGLSHKTVGVEGLAGSGANALLRISMLDGRSMRHILTPGEPSFLIPAEESTFTVFKSYASLGMEHILSGYDHLLFVLGLLLLVGWGSKLVWTVTAFTLGHSITLALASLGLVNMPQQPVEAAIAFSIFILAVEVVRHAGRGSGSWLKDWPYVMAVLFGLLHGLGFAGALTEIGLPQTDIPLTLFAFNLGIEAGQLLFIGVLLAAWKFVDMLNISIPVWLRMAPAYGIGCMGAFWFIERTWSVIGNGVNLIS